MEQATTWFHAPNLISKKTFGLRPDYDLLKGLEIKKLVKFHFMHQAVFEIPFHLSAPKRLWNS